PPRAPAPPPAAPRPAPASSDWRDWPLTPGVWRYRPDDRGSLAAFGLAGAEPVLTLRCDRAARQVALSRPGTRATPLTIRTTSVTRALPVQPGGATPPTVTAVLAANDSLLDAIGFSRGRFIVEQAGLSALVIPAWAEIERVTEDCR
ncbi:hypothetical protein, partial [Sphingomonas sp. GC_Shp_1]|uniref:hypothetical protein n=3 Tax=unclassified Sphingomonas TaxID=196159 RepID=UPI00226BA940